MKFPVTPLLLNIAAAAASTIAIVVISVATRGSLPPELLSAGSRGIADIGVEHADPLALSFEMSSLEGVSIVEIGIGGEERVLVSIPESWTRREVRGALIADVTSDAPSFGFTRWSLPGGSAISFRVPETPDGVVLHNPSGVALKVTVVRVALPEETVVRDVLLVQEGSKELW